MALLDPCLFLQSDAHPARSTRAMFTMQYDEGTASLLDMRVTQRGAGANFSVDIAPGVAYVQGDSTTGNVPQTSLQGHYLCWNDATVNDATTAVASAPSAGNERYDLVVLEVKDNAEDAGGVNKPQFRVVAGTPATVGTATPPSLPNTALLLATIGPIVNGTTSITDSLITPANIVAGRRCTPGTVEWQAGSIVPNGWLACDGTAVSRTTYARLFAHIGTSYGVGNGSTTFNLPDLRGKVAVPVKSGQAQVDTIGETGGEYTHTLTTAQMPNHAHDYDGHTATAGVVAGSGVTPALVGEFSRSTSNEGSGSAFNVMQPYQVVGLAVIRT